METLFEVERKKVNPSHGLDGKFCSKKDAEIAKKLKRNRFLEMKVKQQNRIMTMQLDTIRELLDEIHNLRKNV